eukprot:scaffold23708_cov63-Phaeocystis_antarctica.AAC.3
MRITIVTLRQARSALRPLSPPYLTLLLLAAWLGGCAADGPAPPALPLSLPPLPSLLPPPPPSLPPAPSPTLPSSPTTPADKADYDTAKKADKADYDKAKKADKADYDKADKADYDKAQKADKARYDKAGKDYDKANWTKADWTPAPPPPSPSSPTTSEEKADSQVLWAWAVLPLSALLITAVVLLVLYFRRISRDRANLRISRDRANLDQQMLFHQVQIQVQTSSDDSASLPESDSLPPKRSVSLAKAPAASLPPGPPSSSTGRSVAEREVTRSGAMDSGVVPTTPSPLAAPTVLEYCRKQRLLLPASLDHSEREKAVSHMWKALSVPLSWATGARELSGVTPQAPTAPSATPANAAACTSAVD